MSADDATAKLIKVHQEYQKQGGYKDADKITETTVPLADLEDFESDFIPEIIRKVARDLGCPLKNKRVKNIYVEKGRKLSLKEIGRKFNEIYAPKEKECKA